MCNPQYGFNLSWVILHFFKNPIHVLGKHPRNMLKHALIFRQNVQWTLLIVFSFFLIPFSASWNVVPVSRVMCCWFFLNLKFILLVSFRHQTLLVSVEK